MLVFQVHGMTKAFQRGALIADLLVKCGEGSLVPDGYGRLPRRAAPLGFTIRSNRLLELSLGDAGLGKQAHEYGVGPECPVWQRSQRCFDSHCISVTQGRAVLLEQDNEPVPVLGLTCQVHRVEGIDVQSSKK